MPAAAAAVPRVTKEPWQDANGLADGNAPGVGAVLLLHSWILAGYTCVLLALGLLSQAGGAPVVLLLQLATIPG
jgi:hypothetical protein